MTALENVMSGCIFGRGKEKAMHSAREAATKILEKVGLANQAEVAAQFLTPSQCRRLEIARAMSTSPKLLLLDEAMAGLDADEAEDIMSLVRVIRESGVAVMIIEHVMRVVLSLSERIIVLNNGRKIFEGKPEEVIKDGSVLAAYLGGRFVPQ